MTPNAGELADRQFWFVGAYFDDREPQDQTGRFLADGIWENGFEDRHLDLVKSMQPGDRIAIKASYTRKQGLPFDSRNHLVSTMLLKAIGTVKHNRGDGRTVEVEWVPFDQAREWYFFTGRSTVWKVTPSDWKRRALISFAFNDEPQDLDKFAMIPSGPNASEIMILRLCKTSAGQPSMRT